MSKLTTMTKRTPATILVLFLSALQFPRECQCFVSSPSLSTQGNDNSNSIQPPSSIRTLPMPLPPSSPTARRMVHNIRDADFLEMTVGGERYEMVPLPDSMMDTTIFVGNLCEFCHDGDLSNIFSSVSRLQSVPACVVRRPNMASLEYAFVAFPSVEEKEVRV